MKHPGTSPWYVKDTCGPLFVFYCANHRFCTNDDERRINWYICPDDEDKCTDRRAIVEGSARSPEEAMQQVAAAVTAIAQEMLAWVTIAPAENR